MGDNKGDTSKKQAQQQTQQQQQQISSSPKDPLEESTETRPIIHHPPPPPPPPAVVVVTGAPSFYVPTGATSSPFEQQQFESVNPKRPRYTATTGQWKLLPSPSSQQKQTPTQLTNIHTTEQSSPSPTTNPPTTTTTTTQPQTLLHSTAASSSDTASSPSHSPLPSLSAASGQDTNKPEGSENPVHHHQFRKGKYVSPVWKPNEMLWLARAWRVQYQGGDGSGPSSLRTEHHTDLVGTQTRTKTRADKDKEVAEFLQRQGVNRDAKTAGTKWDNMLGEFRKVYEWERGGEREQVGKSYFRLSPYERKLHRLPASFDEEVFEELSQFMGSRMRSTPQSRGGSGIVETTRSLPAPPSFKDDELHLSAASAGRTKHLMMMSGSGGEQFYHGGRPSLGFESASSMDVGGPSPLLLSSSSSKELRRIGKIRMIWEESVSLWGEEGEQHRGRVRLQGSSFLNADEVTYFDDSMVACTMETFEDGPLRGFSVDRFVSGQQVKVFGRRKSSSSSAAAATSSGFSEKIQLPFTEPSIRSFPPWEFQDPTEYYVGCLRVPPQSLPSLFELSWYLQEPPPEELRFPLRKDVYRDLPQGKELFLTMSSEMLDCRSITYDIISPITRANPSITTSTATSRDSFIGLWDDCINRIVSKFCSVEMVTIRKPTSQQSPTEPLQDQWPNLTGFVRNFCLWRGEEIDQLREGHVDPSTSIVEKLLWTYIDLPYILGYYAVGYVVTFCALSRIQDRIVRTDLHTVDLSSPSERLKALVPCYRIAGLLPLLADRCLSNINNGGGSGSGSGIGGGGGSSSFKMLPYSDFERIDVGNGNLIEMTPNTVTRYFSNRRKWTAVKEIYDFLDHRIPHAEFIHRSLEKDLALVFKPRGCKFKPSNFDQLVEALKYVTKALVALHDLSFMHRDLSWDKVMRRCDRENEWFVCGFDEAVSAPQIYPSHPTTMRSAGGGGEAVAVAVARGRHAPEMERGLHGVKVDVWGVGHLVRSCGLAGMPKMLRELQKRCLDQNPEQRPTAADCYHHLLQLQSSLSVSAVSAGGAAGVLI